MLLTDVLLAPYRGARLAVQLVDDVHDLAERMRAEEDPFSRLREKIDDGLIDLDAVAKTAGSLDGHLVQLLRETTLLLAGLRELIDGGADLTQTAKHFDGTAERFDADALVLTEVAASLDASLKVFRAAMPQLLGALDTVEELEESLETVAETVEPLQKTAEKVGKVTERFSRS